MFNTLIVGGAHRYVYCADDDLLLGNERGGVFGERELFADAARSMRIPERQGLRKSQRGVRR